LFVCLIVYYFINIQNIEINIKNNSNATK